MPSPILVSLHLSAVLLALPPKVKVAQSCPTLCDPMDCIYSPWNSSDQNTGVGSHSLLQGIFPTKGSKPGFLHCRWTLYQLSHKGNPRILAWVAIPFSCRSSQLRNRTRVSCIAGEFFTTEPLGMPLHKLVPNTAIIECSDKSSQNTCLQSHT